MKKRIGNKTIVIFSAYIPPHLGGIERYIDNLSRKLVEKLYDLQEYKDLSNV